MHVWVDADAYPTLRIPPSPLPKGFDGADTRITELMQPGELVITADIPLAANISPSVFEGLSMDLLADGHRLEGPGVQDVDRPAHIERFSQPARARRPRVQVKAGCFVLRSECLDGIVGDRWRRRDIGQTSSVRSPEPQLPVELSFYLISLLVDGAVMAPAEHREVRERGGPALGPVTEVMALAERRAAAWEAAAAIAMV